MLAKHPLKRGDLISAAHPVLLVHPIIEDLLAVLDREALLRTAIDQLPDATKTAFRALATSFHDPRIAIQDVMVTNAFQLYLRGQNHIAIVPEPARINHACAPNAIYHLPPDTFTHVVRAVRDVPAAAEISTTYTEPLAPTPQRRATLRNAFHFDCACARCSAGDDARLERIHALRGRLERWERPQPNGFDDALGPPSVAMAEELVSLYEQEGLQAHVGTAYGLAALSCSAVRKKECAAKYAELAVEALEMKEGPGGGMDGERMVELRDGVGKGGKGHWSWGLRHGW
jgi:hypothetical protein